VEGALRAGEALHDDLGVLVDQNAHVSNPLFLAPSSAGGRRLGWGCIAFDGCRSES